jgi:hypothetical protein
VIDEEKPDAGDAGFQEVFSEGNRRLLSRNRRQRKELDALRARYDSGAVAPGIYAIIKQLETEIAWKEHE